MSTPSFQTGRRKIAPPFGGFTPAAGRSPILCLAAQILRWPQLGMGGEKRGLIFAPTHGYLGQGTFWPSTCAKIPKKRHDPHFDTLGNGFILGNFHACDPWIDPKACLPTHTDFRSTTHSFSSQIRWHLSWHRYLWLCSLRKPHNRRRSWRQARKTGTVFSRIPRPRKSPEWPALPATVTQSRRRP